MITCLLRWRKCPEERIIRESIYRYEVGTSDESVARGMWETLEKPSSRRDLFVARWWGEAAQSCP